MATDLLSTIRREIDERLNELRPFLAERQRLLVAADALVEARSDGAEVEARTTARRSVDSRAKAPTPIEPSRQSAPKTRSGAEAASPLKTKPERAARGAAREAILGALEHGSHTVGELAVVTAMSAPNINGNLRRLEAEGVVVKAEREGKAAWALLEATG
ncbi:MAG: helix-turn-helix domain-containing protein [Solirubrobacteraceae bacterium]